MKTFLYTILLTLGLAAASSMAMAATERYEFKAKLVSGTLACGPAVGDVASCPELFGALDEDIVPNDLMNGLMIGGTYPGRIDLTYNRTPGGRLSLSRAACHLNGRNCLFADDFVPYGAPSLGPAPGRLDFTENSSGQLSLFFLNGGTGTYFYATDFLFDDDGSVFYYSNVAFDLKDIEFTPVPVPPAFAMMLAGLGLFGVMRRRKT